MNKGSESKATIMWWSELKGRKRLRRTYLVLVRGGEGFAEGLSSIVRYHSNAIKLIFGLLAEFVGHCSCKFW